MGFEKIESTANRLRFALANAGMKQIELSRITGIDKGAISHYLKGKYEPKSDSIFLMAKALNVSEMWLWGYDCNMERKQIAEQIEKAPQKSAELVYEILQDEELVEILEDFKKLDIEKRMIIKGIIRSWLAN